MNKITLVGILNVTPDSFSDGGLYFENESVAVDRITEMLSEGADCIDIGGESTRPGSEAVPAEEQIHRVVPIISAARKKLGTDFDISVDTNKAAVAKAALAAGATVVNALGGFSADPQLATVVQGTNCRCIIYHIRGVPQTMQTGTIEYENIFADIAKFFQEQIEYGVQKGMNRNQFILDPGIGFGKTVEHNLEIIKQLDRFSVFELPLLIGVSRKSHLGALLERKLGLAAVPEPSERLPGALAETGIAIQRGATFVRTHDVKATKYYLTVLEELL